MATGGVALGNTSLHSGVFCRDGTNPIFPNEPIPKGAHRGCCP